jgi:hypothetical protein
MYILVDTTDKEIIADDDWNTIKQRVIKTYIESNLRTKYMKSLDFLYTKPIIIAEIWRSKLIDYDKKFRSNI